MPGSPKPRSLKRSGGYRNWGTKELLLAIYLRSIGVAAEDVWAVLQERFQPTTGSCNAMMIAIQKFSAKEVEKGYPQIATKQRRYDRQGVESLLRREIPDHQEMVEFLTLTPREREIIGRGLENSRSPPRKRRRTRRDRSTPPQTDQTEQRSQPARRGSTEPQPRSKERRRESTRTNKTDRHQPAMPDPTAGGGQRKAQPKSSERRREPRPGGQPAMYDSIARRERNEPQARSIEGRQDSRLQGRNHPALSPEWPEWDADLERLFPGLERPSRDKQPQNPVQGNSITRMHATGPGKASGRRNSMHNDVGASSVTEEDEDEGDSSGSEYEEEFWYDTEGEEDEDKDEEEEVVVEEEEEEGHEGEEEDVEEEYEGAEEFRRTRRIVWRR